MQVDAGSEGQRVDNFLLRVCKGVPRSHIYRILRTGEVRVNSRRVSATYRLRPGDRVRIPPVRTAETSTKRAPPGEFPIVYEDESLLVVDKPAGVAVHGGSGVSFGVIESLRAARPQARFLELAHRLDRETSGLLVLAKRRPALVALHAALRRGDVKKCYLALVRGKWRDEKRTVNLPLKKFLTHAGERRVNVSEGGREAQTLIRKVKALQGYTLVSAQLLTGRTHQIRVHLAHIGFPIVGDGKYGDFELNRAAAKQGLKRMFLHAADLQFRHPVTEEELKLESRLPPELEIFVRQIEAADPCQRDA